MTLTAQIAGLRYSGFISYQVTRSVEDLSGSFTITLSSSDGGDPRFRCGDTIVVYANETPILTGYIDKRSIEYGDDSHIITISGRDKVADIVDSTIGAKIELKAPVSLPQVISKVIKNIGLAHIPVHNLVDTKLDPFAAGELVSGQIDETVFEFLEKYTRKRAVLMTTDGKGGFILTRAGQRRADMYLAHLLSDPVKTNIKEASKEEDHTERFHTYRITSQGNPSASIDLRDLDNHRVANRVGKATDSEIRSSRVLDLTAESSSDLATLTERAKWEANVRRARSLTYNCTVWGHLMTYNGKPWEPNLLVKVMDEYAAIDDVMLIKSVEYSLDIDSGSLTRLELVVKDAYLPEPDLPRKKKRHGKLDSITLKGSLDADIKRTKKELLPNSQGN